MSISWQAGEKELAEGEELDNRARSAEGKGSSVSDHHGITCNINQRRSKQVIWESFDYWQSKAEKKDEEQY